MFPWFKRLIDLTLLVLTLGLGAVAVGAVGREAPVDTVGAPSSTATVDRLAFRTGDWLDTSDRDVVLAAYVDAFSADVADLDWTGDHDACDGGDSSAAVRRVTIDRVNYYRAMAGVPAVITERDEFNDKARAAAIMMSVEGSLTHSPGADFSCHTDAGAEGAANANLYLGRTGPDAIDGYIEDPGEKNTDVGHRNTILHPPTRWMGSGDVGAGEGAHASNALWVFDEHVFDETSPARPAVREPERFVAWPPRGYVPADLVHPRWSLMVAEADFSVAEVTMHHLTADGPASVGLTIVDRVGAPGHVPLPAVVWEPELDLSGGHSVDQVFLVVVDGVRPMVHIGPETASPFDAGLAAPSELGPPTRFAYVVRVLGDAPARAGLGVAPELAGDQQPVEDILATLGY
ncbi:MAG: CAP domain-containing protein [Actinomycetota bacterium]